MTDFSSNPNPYAVNLESEPLGQSGVTDVDSIRKAHLSHEASVKSIGVLYLLGALFGIFATLIYAAMGISALGQSSESVEGFQAGVVLLVLAVIIGAMSILQFVVGRGLRRLTPWCRIAGIVISCLGLIGFPIGTLISVYFLYLLLSQKGSYVFSPEYAQVIAATPHIQYKTSIVVWIFLGLLLLVIFLAIVFTVIGTISR